MARAIGLTRRHSRDWRMAEEITGALRALDAADPVKYDFALCHKRMSGDCLGRPTPMTFMVVVFRTGGIMFTTCPDKIIT